MVVVGVSLDDFIELSDLLAVPGEPINNASLIVGEVGREGDEECEAEGAAEKDGDEEDLPSLVVFDLCLEGVDVDFLFDHAIISIISII